jgi:lipid II:glycine glycyltransferase (peptidoglycan interpeptide bridge formation enzyme)
LINYLRKNRVVSLYISPMTRSNDGEILRELGFSRDRNATFIVDLQKEEDEIYNSFKRECRYEIRQALCRGVEIKFYEGDEAKSRISEYMMLQEILFAHKKGNYSKQYYKSEYFLNKIFDTCCSQTILAVAYFNQKPAAANIFVLYKNQSYYYFGVSDFNAIKRSFASKLLMYEMIKYARENGMKYHDQGGIPYSTDPSISTNGVYRFKKEFGGERKEFDIGYYVIREKSFKLIWNLQKYQNHRLIHMVYSIIKRN